MFAPRWILLACGIAALSSGTLVGQTDAGAVPPSDPEQQVKSAEPDCLFFGPDRERYFTDALRRRSGMPPVRRLSVTTDAVGKMLGYVPGGSRSRGQHQCIRDRCSLYDALVDIGYYHASAPASEPPDWQSS